MEEDNSCVQAGLVCPTGPAGELVSQITATANGIAEGLSGFDASSLNEMSGYGSWLGRDGAVSMDTLVHRLIEERHSDHADHFLLEIEIVKAGISVAVEMISYLNLHSYSHRVWVICQCGDSLLLE